MKPLSDCHVLDFSKVLAGPLCAQYLGDLGAEVIKVEHIEHGDDTRHWPPFHAGDGTVFLSANRNKRSIALDLKSAAGREVALRLAKDADVVIESFGPGVAARLGIDYATLKAGNPKLVYASISGFGRTGPMKDEKGYDVILQAFSGMMSITGEEGGPPLRSPFSPVDQTTGIHAFSGILAALLNRARTGEGTLVEVSLFDTSLAFLAYFVQGYWETGLQPKKPGSGHESLCPYGAFSTADADLLLGIANDSLWRKFCAINGLPAAAQDPRFTTNALRVSNRADTDAVVQAVLGTKPRDEWLQFLRDNDIPCAPINSFADVMAHPHTGASAMIAEVRHAHYGTLKTMCQPINFDGQRNQPQRPPPLHGEHTREILQELGYSANDIRRLESERTVFNNAAAAGNQRPGGRP